MRFQRTRDILEHVRQYHQTVSKHCERVSGETNKKRLKLLVDYVSEREQSLADALQHFVRRYPTQWIRFRNDS